MYFFIDKLASDWYRRAQLALEKGDEDLAREALSRRQIQVEISDGLSKQISTQAIAIEKLYSSMTALESKIMDAKRQKDAYIARARTAKTAVQVNDMLSSMTGTTSMDAFDRMKAKVETLEAQAEVAGELAASSSGSSVNLEERFKSLEVDSKLEDELEMLRRQLPGQQKVPEQLPSKSAASASNAVESDIDIEYERLKKELGRK
jgi:phage shock protein A